jgi:glycerate kinase
VPPGARDPERTTSYGSGELLAAACASGAARIVVGIGGSATSDGGCGLAQALGVRFFDAHGDLIAAPLTGAMLDSIARIDSGQRLPGLAAVEIVVASDVQSPLTGPQGAAAVYGPQKGATPEQVRRLDAGLTHLARRIREDLGLDIEAVPGSGAAGGMGAGLVAFANARLASGIETVLEVTGFARRVAGCDLCLTGEGRIDSQSLAGKACIGVAQAAAREDVRTVALVGARGAGWEQCLAAGLAEIRLIGDGLPEDESLRRAEALIATAAGAVALQYRA